MRICFLVLYTLLSYSCIYCYVQLDFLASRGLASPQGSKGGKYCRRCGLIIPKKPVPMTLQGNTATTATFRDLSPGGPLVALLQPISCRLCVACKTHNRYSLKGANGSFMELFHGDPVDCGASEFEENKKKIFPRFFGFCTGTCQGSSPGNANTPKIGS